MVGFADAIADDYRMMDGGEAVTLRVRQANGSFAEFPLAIAHKLVQSRLVQQESGELLRQHVTVWLLWRKGVQAVGVPAPAPKVGDLVRQADGTEWALETVALGTFDTVWECQARRLLTATR
jgi:hypothetical protein